MHDRFGPPSSSRTLLDAAIDVANITVESLNSKDKVIYSRHCSFGASATTMLLSMNRDKA